MRAERDAALAGAAQPARARRPDEDTVLREVGEAGRHRHATTSSWPAPRIDMERAARLSGSRFAYLRGELVMLELALVRYALEKLPRRGLRAGDPAGARPRAGAVRHRHACPTPSSRSTACRTTTCTWSAPPRWRWPRCTATRSSPPRSCRAATPASRRCFRREAGAAGKDTRGIFRVHQFDKVEMFCVRRARGRRRAEHERLLAIEESILQELEIPYRVVAIAVGDLGASAAKKYDCEAWLPGPGPLPRADLVLEHHRLSRRGGSTSATAPADGKPGARPHAQRHGGRGRAHDHRAARERPARRRLGGLPAALVRYGAPAVLPPRRLSASAAQSTDRSGGARPLARARSAPRGAVRRRRSAPASARRRCSTAARDARRARRRRAPLDDRRGETLGARGLGVGGHQQLGHRPVDRQLLVTPSSRSARRDIAWTRSVASTTRNASCGLGQRRRRGSSSRPSPQAAQTRASGAGGSPPGAGAAQCPQNHSRSRMHVRRAVHQRQCGPARCRSSDMPTVR